MQTRVGDKVTITLPGGLRWPGQTASRETSKIVSVISNRTGLPVDIEVTRVSVLSLRQTRPDPETGEISEYLALSDEVVMYGFSQKMEPRFSTILGLDVEEDGKTIRSLQSLLDQHGITYSAFQAAQFEARNGGTDAASI